MRLIYLLLFATTLAITASSQAPQTKPFWQNVAKRYKAGQLNQLSKSMLVNNALKLGGTLPAALGRAENVANDIHLQDQLCLQFLLGFGNSDFLKHQLADMCGSYSLGNKMANYIVQAYTFDKRYVEARHTEKQKRKTVQPVTASSTEAEEITKTDTPKELVTPSKAETPLYDVEEQVPASWRKFLATTPKSDSLDKNIPPGTYTAKVQFTVDTDGSVTDVKVLNSVGYGVEREALRVMSLAPKFTPAMYQGKPVKAIRTQPITFVISE
ncbi:MAG: energy transducer TonB [Chitinophagaceae bacterium]|nr:MAG: energy transducer TonB [Chitinophagaceae bacterium]